MNVPIWLTLGVGVLALVWGVYRIRVAFRSDEEDQRARARKGLFGLARRTHFLFGVVYLLLAAGLFAAAFGWSPLGMLFAPRAEPSRAPAPTKLEAPPRATPVETQPPAKPAPVESQPSK